MVYHYLNILMCIVFAIHTTTLICNNIEMQNIQKLWLQLLSSLILCIIYVFLNKKQSQTTDKNNTESEYDMVDFICESGRLDSLKYLIEDFGKEIKSQKCLYLACQNGHLNVVKYLIQKMNKQTLDKKTMIMHAIEGKYLNLIKYFVDDLHYDKMLFADYLVEGEISESDTAISARVCDYEIIKYFVDKNDYELNKYLFENAHIKKNISIISYLRETRHLRINKIDVFNILDIMICDDAIEIILEFL